MKTEKLYELLGLKPYVEPVRPRYEYIISNEAAALFKIAAKAIEQNHSRQFSISYANLMITEYKEFNVIKYVTFKHPTNLESLRGMTLDNVYIDEYVNINDLAPYRPAFKNIIYLDKPEEV